MYEALRERIIELELAPGERLVEVELARQFHVSKTPIREALANLASDGLVDFLPFRGATVSWLSTTQMLEQRFLIDNLELPAIQLVVERISDLDLAQMRNLLDQLRRARRLRNGRLFRSVTAKIHEDMFSVTGYPRLTHFISTLVGPIGMRYSRVFMDDFPDTWDLHLEMSERRMAGLEARDAELTARAVLECRNKITALNLGRIDHPLVRPYFEPASR